MTKINRRKNVAFGFSVMTALLGLATTASAVSVSIHYSGMKGSNKMRVEGENTRYAGGLLKIDSSDPEFYGDHAAFCVETGQHISSGNYELLTDRQQIVGHETYNDAGELMTMTAEKVDLLERWYGQYFLSDNAGDWQNTEATAFQWGIWKILHEESFGFDDLGPTVLDSGDWQIDRGKSDSTARQAADLANSWFAGLDPAGAYSPLKLLTSPNRQDLLVFSNTTTHPQDGQSVPEPATCITVAGGAIALFRYRRKR